MINLRVAARTLLKTPLVTIVAMVSLAFGIGATAAIFSLFDQALVRPLPVPEPSQLVNLSAPGPRPGSNSCTNAGPCDDVFSYAMFRDLERVQTVFSGIAAHRSFQANLAYGGQTLSAQGVLVSGSYFPVLQLVPAAGRLLGPGDDRRVDESHVLVLSHAYWAERFAGDRSVVGRSMIANGQTMTIVGVAPAGFTGTTVGAAPQIFVPITMRALMESYFKGWNDRNTHWAYLFARLKPGTSIDQARASLGVQYHNIVNDVEAPMQTSLSPQTLARFKTKALVMSSGARGQSLVSTQAYTPLGLLFGVTILVLLIACGNIANLLLARAAARSGEMALRLSLGATRWHLVTQLLTEACMLAVAGGLAGLFVAQWTLTTISAMLPLQSQLSLQLTLDNRVLWFACAVTLGTGLLCGLCPAWHATRPDLLSTIKGQGGAGGGRGAARVRASLATAQIALSMALLVAAGLFIKSLANVSHVNIGLDADRVATFHVSPTLNGYSAVRSHALLERLEDDLRAIPGVADATANTIGLVAGDGWGQNVSVQGFSAGPDTDTDASINEIGPGYFRALVVTLRAGREFTAADAGQSPKVAIVSEAFVKKFNLGADAVGKYMGFNGSRGKLDTEIVGVVPDMKYSDVKSPPPPIAFRPYRQDANNGDLNFYVRTPLDPEQLFPAIRQAVAELDRTLPVENLVTLPQQIRNNVFLDRIVTLLSAAFATLATLLAAIGLYGVLAYTVAQRTREIGLRIALGAEPARVRLMALAQLGRMMLVGGGIGLLIAFGVGRTAESILFGLKGSDPIVLVGSALLLTLVAFAAGWAPAYRASSVDPMHALRHE